MIVITITIEMIYNIPMSEWKTLLQEWRIFSTDTSLTVAGLPFSEPYLSLSWVRDQTFKLLKVPHFSRADIGKM